MTEADKRIAEADWQKGIRLLNEGQREHNIDKLNRGRKLCERAEMMWREA